MGCGGNGISALLSPVENVLPIDSGRVRVAADFLYNEDNEDGLGCVRKAKER